VNPGQVARSSRRKTVVSATAAPRMTAIFGTPRTSQRQKTARRLKSKPFQRKR
jgi:hypothetical protein